MNKLFSKIAALSVGLAMAVGVGVAVGSKKAVSVKAAETTVTKTTAELATSEGWTVSEGSSIGTKFSSVALDSNVTVSFAGSGNTATYWAAGDIRVYGTKSATDGSVTVTGGTNVTIKTFKLTFTLNNSPTFPLTSGTADTVNAQTKTYTMTSGSKAGQVRITAFEVVYEMAGSFSTMIVKDSAGNQSPFAMSYGDPSGLLFYAYEDDGTTQITSGVTWSVSNSSVLTLDSDFADNHCWVKPGQPGEATLSASKSGYTTVVSTINVSKGSLASIAVSGSMTKTGYKVGDNWDPSGLVVTATYSTGYQADVTSSATWAYNPATATSTSVVSVVATATYEEATVGKSASSSAQTVSVAEGVTYDLTQIDGFSSWNNSYTDRNVSSSDVGASVAATMAFKITNKQSSGVGSTYPCIGSKTNAEMECLTFTLTESNKKITTVDITFVTRYTSTFPSLYLHKGSGIASEAVSSLTMSGAAASEHSLSCNNLNDTVFTVGYNAHQTSSNGAVGIKSISIGLAEAGSFGTLDHIKVSSAPTNSVYHVGEVYDATGLAVTAYDGANEATANFKDVTADATYSFANGTTLTDSHVPGVTVTVSYSTAADVSFSISVYALAEYELVTEAPADWSGNYLIVGTNYNSDLVAMNGGLTNPDTPDGYKVVSVTDDVIETGQELEWTIAAVSGGYSIQGKSGKYIGSLTASSNGMLVSDSALVNTLSYETDATVITGTNGYKLKIYNDTATSRFRYYSSGSVQLYRLKESSGAADWAQSFLDGLHCDSTGETAPSVSEWNALKVTYNSLSNADKELFRLGVASKTGTVIQQALARYDLVVTKYNSTQTEVYEEFMGRVEANVIHYSSANQDLFELGNNNMAIIVVLASVSGLIVVGTLLILKKKRHN